MTTQTAPDAPDIPYGPTRNPWSSQIPDIARDAAGQPLITAPDTDPALLYQAMNAVYGFQELQVPEPLVQVPPDGQTAAQRRVALDTLKAYIARQRDQFLGYQVAERIDYASQLAPLLDAMTNNIGDPYVNGYFTVNSKSAERAVLDFLASLWHGKWPSQGAWLDPDGSFHPADPESYWGYVLSMGSTEGNLFATLNARNYLTGTILLSEDPDGSYGDYTLFEPKAPADNPNMFTPIAFFSEDTHYSVTKAVRAMGIRTFYEEGMLRFPGECPLPGGWPEAVPSSPPSAEFPIGDGAIDIERLCVLVDFFAQRGYPVYLVLNYGTTFKGAYDDVQSAGERLMPIFERYGLLSRRVKYGPHDTDYDERAGYWIHVDGALGASFMPFVDMAVHQGLLPRSGPVFDFRLPFVSSIVTSGHKWPGAPMPCGAYLSRQKFISAPPDRPGYIGSPDSTFAGSRNGLSSLVLWQVVASQGYRGFYERALQTLALCDFTFQRLTEIAQNLKTRYGLDIWLQRSPLSMSIIFRKPKDEIMFRYSLCTAKATVPGANSDPAVSDTVRTYVHMFCMWDRDRSVLEDLFAALSSPQSYDPQSEQTVKRFTPPDRSAQGRVIGKIRHGLGWE